MAQVVPIDLAKTGGRLPIPGTEPHPEPPPRPGGTWTPPQPATPAAAQGPPSESPAAPPVCRHCNKDPNSDPDKIDPEDLVAFARSVWRNEPFSKSYTFFGGAVRVEFQSLSTDQVEAAQRAVLAAAAKDETVGGILNMLSFSDRIEEHQLGFSVKTLIVGDNRYDALNSLDTAAVLAGVRKVTGNQIPYQTVRTAYRTFYVLVQNLIRAGTNPSFWEATPPSGPSPASPTPATRA